ncbi:MAG: hypothetical protein [Anelloviridae sp.]|nr:MAG: hypothetical protein [Anelloviridae sp.]
MSKFLTPCLYSGKSLENQWVNCIFNSHDLICGCNDTIKHLATILQTKQLCLPSTSTVEDGTQTEPGPADEDGFDEGDLDRLFADSFEEDDG